MCPLNQIDRSNVGKPRMVRTRGLGPGIQEGMSLVHQGILYFPNPTATILSSLRPPARSSPPVAASPEAYVAVSMGNSLVSGGLNRLAPELKPSAASNIVVFLVGE